VFLDATAHVADRAYQTGGIGET